jgi:hypothetical protein
MNANSDTFIEYTAMRLGSLDIPAATVSGSSSERNPYLRLVWKPDIEKTSGPSLET